MVDAVPPRRPSLPVRAAAGAWHVPAGFGFLLRRPALWGFAALPAALALLLTSAGLVLGVFLGARVEARFAPAPGQWPVWIEVPASLLLWVATVGSGVFLGLGLALAVAAPILDQLSRQVEARVRGHAVDRGRGLRWEIGQSLRGSLYFLAAAPGVFLLGLVPVIGPLLSAAWGARAIAFQMTDPALTRRGLAFAEKRRWHRGWRPESMGFGLAGMVGLLVPLANLLVGPALVAGGTLLVLDLEDLDADRPRPAGPGAERD
jgi:CysZ protein